MKTAGDRTSKNEPAANKSTLPEELPCPPVAPRNRDTPSPATNNAAHAYIKTTNPRKYRERKTEVIAFSGVKASYMHNTTVDIKRALRSGKTLLAKAFHPEAGRRTT